MHDAGRGGKKELELYEATGGVKRAGSAGEPGVEKSVRFSVATRKGQREEKVPATTADALKRWLAVEQAGVMGALQVTHEEHTREEGGLRYAGALIA